MFAIKISVYFIDIKIFMTITFCCFKDLNTILRLLLSIKMVYSKFIFGIKLLARWPLYVEFQSAVYGQLIL